MFEDSWEKLAIVGRGPFALRLSAVRTAALDRRQTDRWWGRRTDTLPRSGNRYSHRSTAIWVAEPTRAAHAATIPFAVTAMVGKPPSLPAGAGAGVNVIPLAVDRPLAKRTRRAPAASSSQATNNSPAAVSATCG